MKMYKTDTGASFSVSPLLSPSTKMLLKSSVLLFFIAIVVDGHLFTPFDLVDNYVEDFKSHVERMGKLAEEYRFVQQEYDTLSQEDAKLLLSEFFLEIFIDTFYLFSKRLRSLILSIYFFDSCSGIIRELLNWTWKLV